MVIFVLAIKLIKSGLDWGIKGKNKWERDLLKLEQQLCWNLCEGVLEIHWRGLELIKGSQELPSTRNSNFCNFKQGNPR